MKTWLLFQLLTKLGWAGGMSFLHGKGRERRVQTLWHERIGAGLGYFGALSPVRPLRRLKLSPGRPLRHPHSRRFGGVRVRLWSLSINRISQDRRRLSDRDLSSAFGKENRPGRGPFSPLVKLASDGPHFKAGGMSQPRLAANARLEAASYS